MQHKQAIEYIQKLILQETDKLAYTYWVNTTPQLGNRSSFGELKQKAEEGNFYDQINLAKCYFYGTFTNKDYTQAVNWCEKAVAHDWRDVECRESPEKKKEQQELAYCILAYCYLEEDSVVKNEDNAIEWLKKADTQGSVLAQMILAECCFYGFGCQVDNDQAVKYLEKASGRNEYENVTPYSVHKIMYYKNSLARRKLGFFYLKEKNYSVAIQCFSEAMSSYNSDYSYGRYIMKSMLSELPDRKFINKGLIPIWIELGVCYYYAEEYENALNCFNKLSEEKDGISQLWLAYLTYFKNKPAFESCGPLDKLESFGILISSSFDTYTDAEIKEKYKRDENTRNVMDAEAKITSYLYNSASSFFVKEDAMYCDKGYKDNICYSDMINYVFSEEIISFLEHSEESPAKVILAFYNRGNEEFERYLKQASNKRDILSNYLLGQHYKQKINLDDASIYFKKAIEYGAISTKYVIQDFLSYSSKEELSNIKHQKQLEEKNKELNNLIAMFAHNFLGTLQCIRSNAEHDNNVSIHLKTVKMMSGVLTAFSIISADDDKLIEQFKQDNSGDTNLLQNLANNLALAISQLLSKTNKAKIINLYLNYLRKTNQIEKTTTSEKLSARENRDYRKKWQALQHQWEDEFNALFSENVELSSLQTWLADNFFPVQITGFDNYNIRFKEYDITYSIFQIIFMEILVNALKYMDVSQNQPLKLTLCKQDQHYQLICENPSSQETNRGTRKGMDFLKYIARKLNAQFITESTEQQFKTTFIIPAELLD